MLKGHPKGLFVLALANMGERFGYYTMLAIFVLFIQAKFGFDKNASSEIFSNFLALVYFLPLLGGIVADRFLGYGKTVIAGVVVMFVGYLLLAMPTGVDTAAKYMMYGALGLISIGTGLFKGNIQALVGNLYDDPKYNSKRDMAFSIFYMCINIGAFFAPSAAGAVYNFFLKRAGLFYEAKIPALAHQLTNGTITPEGLASFKQLAEAQTPGASANLQAFGANYIEKLSEGYNYGFGVACVSLVISILIFALFRKYYKAADVTARQQQKADVASGQTNHVEELSGAETKQRLIALCLVFAVVIFFWMAFHQNGLTLTWFARDYTNSAVGGLTRIGFGLPTMVMMIVAFYGILGFIQAKSNNTKVISAIAFLIGAGGAYAYYVGMPEILTITPEIFQQFNPFFIVILTPVSVAFFSMLNSKDKEPSAPRKIGIGMFIAAFAFIMMAIGSLGLPNPDAIASTGGVSDVLVSPNMLIGTYFMLTIAELFLSPMGLSFVSRVAPPKYKGLMQGGWLAATAIGNKCVAIIGYLWGIELWIMWGVLVVLCIISGTFIFSIMKKLEAVSK
ncbi:proton-dependent oligopeptide transporter, POT family [Bacteroides luti]|jgi:amino acid/peptide transporter (Peptide:H+ symporter), bacterial|uniref:Proton-dependent oligopeptide transporter, POT family n=1 Tax=Bacteroides luti TaxID=1297750 RepID=A0A1M4T7U8_9BACE|nr:peptide MFS transporter [Bacteroides luti]SHE40464.1 proton-dependent oligopeptide transporter, POT family [Bacteroides luti]